MKGYTRKGNAYLGLKDTVKASQAFQKAMELDPQNAVSILFLRHLYVALVCLSVSDLNSQHLLEALPHYDLNRINNNYLDK